MSEGNLVLCGPIVRRVDCSSASVFVVTRMPCEVTLTIYPNDQGVSGDPIMQGTRRTISLGALQGAHAVVVTARAPDALQWGESYHYDLAFAAGGHTRTLYDDGVLVAMADLAPAINLLRYPGQQRPGFILPPADPARLRVLHGSCRKPHGDGADALAHADQLICNALESPEDQLRPQQLFLTGDQIYADDVHPSLLTVLRAFGRGAIGEDAELAELLATGEVTSAELEPVNRTGLCQDVAKLTSGSCSSHLIMLSEFYAMHLFAWSLEPWRGPLADTALAALSTFTDELAAVRRALANIATYMIFDDHEITDDWYIRDGWCDQVLGNPLGRRIVRNGLAAYLVFQHWGNAPDEFEPDRPAGRALAVIDHWSGAEATAGALDAILPVPARGADLAKPMDGRIDWWWRWRGPGYEVIALDTRTRRRFDKGGVSLLRESDLDALLHPGEPMRFTIVLSAVPVLGVAVVEWVQKIAAKLDWGLKVDDEPWSHGASFHHLLTCLLDRAPTIVLSGDVHFGFGSTLFDRAAPSKRIVNFISSALKNMSGGLARRGLWALNFTSDDQLQSALAQRAETTSLIVPTTVVHQIDDRTFDEALLSTGQALIVGSDGGDEPGVMLQGAQGHDRTDITGRCNLGDIHLAPDLHKVMHDVWYKDGAWKRSRQTANFWLKEEER